MKKKKKPWLLRMLQKLRRPSRTQLAVPNLRNTQKHPSPTSQKKFY